MTVLQLILFILPAYVANAIPVVLGSGTAMDLNVRFFDRRRLLGRGKTWVGALAGIAAGVIVGIMIANTILIYDGKEQQILSSFFLSAGAIVGDAVGSFIKRRLVFVGRMPMFVVDQVCFFFTAIAFVYPIKPRILTISGFVFLFILTILLHALTNIVAYKLKIKRVPW